MDSPAILWALVVVGGVIALAQAWWLQARVVNVDAATQVLIKILMAGNRERALRLTNAAPQAVYMRAVRAALEDDGQTRDSPQSRFDRALADGLRSLGKVQNAGYLAVLLGGLSVGLAATASAPDLPVVGAGASVVVFALRNLKQLGKLESAARAGFARLVDVLGSSPPVEAPSPAPEPYRAPGGRPASPHDLVLVVTIDGKEVARRKLDENVIKIGRMPTCHLSIEHVSISRMHAVVEVTDEHAEIIDLGSVTGTKHNGNAVNKAVLAAGDVLQLGEARIDVIAADH